MSARRIAALAGVASFAVSFFSGTFSLLPASAASANVSIVASGSSGCASAFCYQPASSSINSGDAVNFTNNSTVPHTVTRCGAAPGQNDVGCPAIGAAGNDGSTSDKFNSPTLSASGGTYSHTFTAGGGYTFYCIIHGYGTMHAAVTVAAAPATPGASPTAAAAPGASPPSLARSGAGPSAAPSSGFTLSPEAALLVVLGLGALAVSARLAARGRP